MSNSLLKCKSRALAQTALALLMCGVSIATAAAIEDQTLRYAVFYGNINAGEIEIKIRNEDAGYVVASTGKPSKLAALFFDAHDTATRFVRNHDDDEVALDSGTERLAGNGGYERSFRFDREHERIEFSDGDRDAIQPGERFEAAAFPLLLMLRPLDGIAGTRVREVSARRTRDYLYEQPVEEIVKVPAGEFPSWKISRHRSDRPGDRVTVWLNKAGDPVPLKIAVTKKGKTSKMLLTGNE